MASAGTDSSHATHKHLIQGNRSPPLSDPGSPFYSCCSAVRKALSACSGCPSPGVPATKAPLVHRTCQFNLSPSSHCLLVLNLPIPIYSIWLEGRDQSQPGIYLIGIWPGNEVPFLKTKIHRYDWKLSHLLP